MKCLKGSESKLLGLVSFLERGWPEKVGQGVCFIFFSHLFHRCDCAWCRVETSHPASGEDIWAVGGG